MKWLLSAAAFTAALLLEFNPALAAQPVCTPDVIATCAQLEKAPLNLSGNKELGFPPSQTGAVIFNGAAYIRTFGNSPEKLEANKKALRDMELLAQPSPTQMAEAVKLGKELRDKAIQIIAGDILPEHYSVEQKVTIERLENLNVQIAPEESKFCWRDVPLGYPNAGYDAETHSLSICAATARQSKSYLLLALGHEIGHAISPCTTSADLYVFNEKSKPAREEALRTCGDDFIFSENGEYNSPDAVFAKTLLETNSSGAVGFDNSMTLKGLASCGVMKRAPNSSLTRSDIFKSTRSCVEKATSKEFEASPARLSLLLNQNAPSSANSNFEERREGDRSCLGVALEQFADAFGSNLYGAVAREKRLKPAEVRASLALYRGSDCDEVETKGVFRNKEQYPSAETRLKTYFNDPNLASILGCEPGSKNGICPLTLDPQPAAAGSMSEENSRASSKAKQ